MSDKGYQGSPPPARGADRHVPSILKTYRNTAVILALGLAILTLLACLPYAPQGPFDARDYTRVAGIRLEQHPWEALIEPLAAPFLILAGAPDFSIAGFSVLIWVLLGAAAWGMFAEYRAQRKKKPFAIALKGIRMALVASSSLILIILLFVVARIPAWRLVVDDPNLLVADLHSHTTKSHDGLVSTLTNLEWHASCGYNVVALTDHDELFAHELKVKADSPLDRLQGFISGVEVHTGQRAMALGICDCKAPPFQLKMGMTDSPDLTAGFCKKIHEGCRGAVIVVTLKRLTTDDIDLLADDGVDGFEIANSGHPDLPPYLRQKVLDTCRSRGLVLAASTDWHGWTGMARTWTVMKAPGALALSPSQRASLAVRKLREHDTDIIPVVAGYIGEPSHVRAIFSPIAESLRYAMELSTARVISWWIWVWAVFVLWAFLHRIDPSPGGIMFASLVGATGLSLIFAALLLIRQGTESVTSFPLRIGLISVAIGAAAVGCSTFHGVTHLMRARRKGRIEQRGGGQYQPGPR
ncbi:MAG: PHP domain-containing protein [Syntrophobacteraceae bacterium]